MTRFLVISIVFLAALTAAGPALVAITQAAVPLVIAAGFVVIALRLAWYFTHRW